MRFFGRRVYVGLIFVLLPALMGSEGPAACHYRTVDAEIIGEFRGAFRRFSSVGVRQCLA